MQGSATLAILKAVNTTHIGISTLHWGLWRYDHHELLPSSCPTPNPPTLSPHNSGSNNGIYNFNNLLLTQLSCCFPNISSPEMNNIVACFVLLFWLGEGKKYQMCTQYGLLMHDQAHWSPPTLILERNFLHRLQLPPARTSVQQIGSRITLFPSDLMDKRQATSLYTNFKPQIHLRSIRFVHVPTSKY